MDSTFPQKFGVVVVHTRQLDLAELGLRRVLIAGILAAGASDCFQWTDIQVGPYGAAGFAAGGLGLVAAGRFAVEEAARRRMGEPLVRPLDREGYVSHDWPLLLGVLYRLENRTCLISPEQKQYLNVVRSVACSLRRESRRALSIP